MHKPTERAAVALAALAAFHVTDADMAMLLLSAWRHWHTMTTADIAAVRAAFVSGRHIENPCRQPAAL
jgi:hypothetical protein